MEKNGCCHEKEGRELHVSFGGGAVMLFRLIAAALLLAGAALLEIGDGLRLTLFIAAFLTAGVDVVINAVLSIFSGSLFDETFLMALAGVAAFVIGERIEAVLLMLLFQLGELLQEKAEGNSRRSVERLLKLRPDTVELLENGEARVIPAEQAAVGDLILLRPGQRLGLDAIVVSGSSTLDTSAITGESLPRETAVGDAVPAGCVNLSGALTLRVTAPLSGSTVSRILELVESATEKKTRTERFITKFARVYTPVVIALAALVAFLPPLLLEGELNQWIHRALVLLIASCPCAIVISVPLTYFTAIGGATRRGILFKGASVVDAIRMPRSVVFDKTGTLTTGSFALSAIKPVDMNGDSLLRYAAAAERFSTHPLAKAIVDAAGAVAGTVEQQRDYPGRGTAVKTDGRTVCCGSAVFLREMGVKNVPELDSGDAVVYVSVDGNYAGAIVLKDTVKPVKPALERLRALGAKKLYMLSGDRESAARAVSEALGLDGYFAECLPEDKAARLSDLLEVGKGKGSLLYVGDGVNDAPVLTLADVGISMGGLGADSAIEASDVVIMDDDLSKLPEAVELARKARRLIWQNIVMALALKLVVIALGAAGIAPIWLAIIADVGVTLLTILNATRAYGKKKER